ncbi:RLA class I histocompatibility antigen, alpha chain 11/11 [Varanus komodoensis]|nr:RLA class I histocompatibility antigen, alpha chain 11/11 [Varanus komodoensis]
MLEAAPKRTCLEVASGVGTGKDLKEGRGSLPRCPLHEDCLPVSSHIGEGTPRTAAAPQRPAATTGPFPFPHELWLAPDSGGNSSVLPGSPVHDIGSHLRICLEEIDFQGPLCGSCLKLLLAVVRRRLRKNMAGAFYVRKGKGRVHWKRQVSSRGPSSSHFLILSLQRNDEPTTPKSNPHHAVSLRRAPKTVRHCWTRRLHTLQWMYGCELSGDGSKGGYMQFGYDGSDYLSLDKEHLRWTAADAKAQLTKRKWEAEPAEGQRWKAYLEETCIEWLRRYLEYGKETLQQRREPPVVKVTRHESPMEDTETLVCRAHGFYPKEIDATWTKDGQSWEHETFRRRVAPNPDGTYYVWLCIDIDPEERGRYRCRVDHAGLSQPLVLAWEGPVGNVWIIVGVVAGALVLLLVVAIIIIVMMSLRRAPRRHCWTRRKSPAQFALREDLLLALVSYGALSCLSPSNSVSNSGLELGRPVVSVEFGLLEFPIQIVLIDLKCANRVQWK